MGAGGSADLFHLFFSGEGGAVLGVGFEGKQKGQPLLKGSRKDNRYLGRSPEKKTHPCVWFGWSGVVLGWVGFFWLCVCVFVFVFVLSRWMGWVTGAAARLFLCCRYPSLQTT